MSRDGTPWTLGVRCDSDGCGEVYEGDFLVDPQANQSVRLGVVLDHVAHVGWTVVGRRESATAATYCPDHPQ
jgi:hypothetical protein